MPHEQPWLDADSKHVKKKGHKNGLCNRSSCLSPDNVIWYNLGSYAYYCPDCANLINKSNFNTEGYNLCEKTDPNTPNDKHLMC